MAGEDGTFSESWYRVAHLRARLRTMVRAHRQRFRGQVWYVVQDPANNRFFRLHPAAWRFVGLLDGRRSVAEAWRICNQQLGDEAPTQNEAVAVLGQLYAANLLQADLPPDTEGLFQRYRKQRARHLRGQAANFLFLRRSLFDPDRLLNVLVGVFAPAFTPLGCLAWAALVAAGAWLALGSWPQLAAEAERLIDREHLPGNLPLMYAVFVLAKAVHEFGHALACKAFGRRTPGGGEVHEMGLMLLVFAPMPYVDASSAWALPSRLHRIVVSAAGMMAELGLAAVAAGAWVATAEAAGPWQQATHAAAFQLMLISSVSTVVFNANPLLQFDGYYILSDLLGIPNLGERSRQYLQYLVKRLAWGVRGPVNPAGSRGEAAWLAGYGAASTAFRVFICVKILLLLAERFFVVGAVLAAAAAVMWVLLPLGRLVHYLLAGAELARTRGRALATTLLLIAGGAAALGLVKAPDDWYVEGVVAPSDVAVVHAAADGFVEFVLETDSPVRGQDADGAGTVLVRQVNRELAVRRSGLGHERDVLLARLRLARQSSAADPRELTLAQVLEKSLADLDRQIEMAERELAGLTVRAAATGRWICPRADRLDGAFARRGEPLGTVASLDAPVVRARLTQRLAGMLLAEADPRVQCRLAARPGEPISGTGRIRPAGRPAEADEGRPFAVEVRPDAPPAGAPALAGERAVIRFRLPARPLLEQWWRSVRQLAQRRFGL
ncbi:MAG TPA: hypothetical protein VM695_14295 [Phycisphaerae bacterium]|nr:hypothetical protein [Phycisphaerae bacterium]